MCFPFRTLSFIERAGKLSPPFGHHGGWTVRASCSAGSRDLGVADPARPVVHQVGALKRIKMAGIRLGSLEPGAWRFLSAKERGSLLKLL